MSEKFEIGEEERRAIDGALAAAPSRNGTGEYIEDVMRERMRRRDFLKSAGAAGAAGVALVALPPLADEAAAIAPPAQPGARLRFTPVTANVRDQVSVPPGYGWNVLVRWGDPLSPAAPPFDVHNQSGERQTRQFGFNCDFIGWFPLPPFAHTVVASEGKLPPAAGDRLLRSYPALTRKAMKRSLLVVNHEYTSGSEMFPGYDAASPTEQQVRVEIEAHGCSVVEVCRTPAGGEEFIKDSPFNRRVTGSTSIALSGPLRGDPRLATGYAPHGGHVRGMLNNCSGGKTPWGTVLTCEENFDQYFANFSALPPDSEAYKVSARIPAAAGATERKWERYVARFDLTQEPNEYARFGYVVEIDPYDPQFMPVKRTALGRFKHEAAVPAITADGHVAVYSGDDSRFEYVYKFVSDGTFNRWNRKSNFGLLDSGTLYVARFTAAGTGEWLPLTPANPKLAGWSLNDILINTRGAADLVGATKMDRPEDIDVSPVTGKVYISLTNNTARTTVAADAGEVAANPRLNNAWGHVIELRENGNDAGATGFTWEILLLCGDPGNPAHGTFFAGFDPSKVSPLACPDNFAFDSDGNLWIATDGMTAAKNFTDIDLGVGSSGRGVNDGVFPLPVEGTDRGYLRQFLSGVAGCELCGPEFSGDNAVFFAGIQHPGEGGGLPNSVSAWPNGNFPPKPSVIAVYKKDGGKVGT